MSDRDESGVLMPEPKAVPGTTDRPGPAHAARSEVWHVYFVRVRDGSLYTGITTDVERRVAEHAGQGGKGAKYLRGRGPLELVFHVEIGSRARALKVESRIKRLTKTRKEQIVARPPGAEGLLTMLGIAGADPAG